MSNSTFKKICIALVSAILIIVAITIGILVAADKLKENQVESFESDLIEELANDEYANQVAAGEVSVSIQVNDSFLQLSNKEKLDKTNGYINLATAVRDRYDRINDGKYVCIHIYTSNGVEIIKSNQKGQSQIITGK